MESGEGGSYWGKEQVRSPEVGRGGVRRAREVPGEEVRTAAASSSLSSKPCTRAYLFGSAVLCTHSRFFFSFFLFLIWAQRAAWQRQRVCFVSVPFLCGWFWWAAELRT